ncbi:hypothetical protein BC827DRAFT_1265706 [Russula dissimulans]|nr:hypothetical protein BC827DRAFT_1265706 [Russula dissimulans]
MRPSLGITDGLPVLVMSAVIKPESNLDRPSSLFSSPVMLDIARTELEKVVSASAYAAPLTPVAHPPSRCFRHSSGTLRGEILVLWRPDFRLVANTIVRQRNSVTLQQWAVAGRPDLDGNLAMGAIGFGIPILRLLAVISRWRMHGHGPPPNNKTPMYNSPSITRLDPYEFLIANHLGVVFLVPPKPSWSGTELTRESDQSTQRIIEGQDLWPSGASAVPYVNQNQGLGNATRIVATMADQAYVPFVSQQSQMNRGDAGYPPPQEAHGPLQAQTGTGLDKAQVLDMIPVSEGLRRLARRYVNNPESLVNAVQLEPAPSGRIQVVIMIEIAEIL